MSEHCQPAKQACYAVMGNPIAHSKSPCIHRLFAKQTDQTLGYDALLIDKGKFSAAVAEFFSAGGKGLNVTVPFKQEAWQITDHLSDRAECAGAVNTLWRDQQGHLHGDNTDGIGLVRDLTKNLLVDLQNKTILLLGAGGAARGALAPLLAEQPASLHIANRTRARALELAKTFAEFGSVQASGFDAIEARQFDVVINATAAGLQGKVPALPADIIGSVSFCYDMMYSTEPTAFMQYAAQQGCHQTCDGLGMLVEQAAEAFHLWRGIMPNTAPVIAALRPQ
ncbi:Shikimate 5-dehydrogenase I alpha [hydrothermal vent metagenome]|uniref:shikimate dehydrogenase (NADP(+)) n=1 Tax=hydrothermal vent metagenome TaxID=652676 RepID=A0A3B0Z1H5_9ZZZZ